MAACSRPCWECSKKRLVCDLNLPRCHKCVSRGIECPGYEKKPLKWLKPGQTRSKGRRARSELSNRSSESTTVAPTHYPLRAARGIPCESLEMVEGIKYCKQMKRFGATTACSLAYHVQIIWSSVPIWRLLAVQEHKAPSSLAPSQCHTWRHQ